jgi:hypothetical protein
MSITVRKFTAFSLMHAVIDKKAGGRHIFGFCATKTMQFLTVTLLYLASHYSLHISFQTKLILKSSQMMQNLKKNSYNCTLQMRNLSMSLFKLQHLFL